MERLKVLIIGPEKSGKSVIANYLYDDLRERPQIYRPTVGFRIIEIERRLRNPMTNVEEPVTIEIWDISGDVKYENTWQLAQNKADGVIVVTNGEKNGQTEETEAWIKNFPKKMKLSPNQCLGLANHPSGKINDYTAFKIMALAFSHCSFESRTSTIAPAVDKFFVKVLEKKLTQAKEY